MKCEPHEHCVKITPENPLEEAALRRWAALPAAVRPLPSGLPPSIAVEFGGGRAGEAEAGEAPPRTIRVPAPGQRARVEMRPTGHPAWHLETEVVGIRVERDAVRLLAGVEGSSVPMPVLADRVTPVGPGPHRFITITLPEDA